MTTTRPTTLTYAGLNLMADCQTGKLLKFTKIVMGNGAIADDQNVRQLSGLVSPKLVLPIVKSEKTGVGTAAITARLNNAALTEGFMATEVGIFAAGDDGVEILYAYRYTGKDSTYVPAGGGEEVWNLQYRYITVIDQAQNVTAVLASDIAYVTETDFEDHINAAKHPYIGADVTTTDNFYAADTTNTMHRITTDNARKLILGDSASTIPVMRSRINQLETELSDITLKMVAANEAPDSNLILAEDFVNPDMVDLYDVQVLSAVAGSGDIDISTDSGVIQGAWYWISDGISSEYIQVRSVIRNGTVFRIRAVQNLTYTYDLPCTHLYRSTSMIFNSIAQGSGDKKGNVWQAPKITWTGQGTNTANTVMLETTQGKSADFTVLDGKADYTADGFLTIGGNE